MTLMPDASYAEALARLAGLLADIPFALDWHIPTGKVITQWRLLIPASVMEEIFWQASGPLVGDDDPSAVMLAGLPVDAADGMLVNLADTPENRKFFGSTGTADDSSPFPQVRVVALTARAGRAMLGAVPGQAGTGEQTLLKRLARPRRDHRREFPRRHRDRRPTAGRGGSRGDRHHRVAQHAARRVQRHRVRRQGPGQPGEPFPHPPRRRAEPAQPVPHRVLRHPGRGRDRPEPLPPGRPHEHLPDHRRPVAPAGQQPRRKKNMRRPARGAPRPPRPDAYRDPPGREDPPPDRVTPPAQPPAAARTRKQAVTEKLLHNGRAVAYREHWCLRAPSRPSPDFAKR
jgi:hypothetical protein